MFAKINFTTKEQNRLTNRCPEIILKWYKNKLHRMNATLFEAIFIIHNITIYIFITYTDINNYCFWNCKCCNWKLH